MADKINTRIALSTDGTGKVVADVHKVTDSVKQSTRGVDALNKSLASIKLATKIAAVASAFSMVSSVVGGIGGAVKSVLGAVDGYASGIDTIAKFGRNVGLSAAQLQQWQYAAERGGMSAEGMNNALKKFSSNVSKAANGEKTQLDIFNAMGIKLKDSNGNLKDTNTLMLEVADAYAKVTNAQDKVRLTEELFGRGNSGIQNVFEGGSGAVQALLDRRKRIGGLVTEQDAKNAETFKDVLLDVSKVKDAIITKGMSSLLPSVTEDLEDFLTWWEANSDKVFEKVKIAADVVGYSVRDFVELVEQAVGVWDNLGDVVKGLGITFSEYANSICESIVGKVKDAFVGAISFIWDGIKTIGSGIANVFSSVFDGVSGLVKSIASGIANMVASLYDMLSSLPVVGGNFARAAESIRSTFAPKQEASPAGASAVSSYTETRTTKTSNLNVNIKGLNAESSVEPEPGFDFGAIDFTAGYAF